MTKNSGSGSTPRRYPRLRPLPMRFPDASHPIYSNPIALMFGKPSTGATPDSEIPEPGKPNPAPPEHSEGKED